MFLRLKFLFFKVSDEKRHALLVQAMCEILSQCNSSNYLIVHQKRRDDNISDVVDEVINDVDSDLENKLFSNTASDPLVFHESLTVTTFNNLEDVQKYYLDNIEIVTQQFGVLLFLYSVIITKVRNYLFYVLTHF